jgi:hypothetical protein
VIECARVKQADQEQDVIESLRDDMVEPGDDVVPHDVNGGSPRRDGEGHRNALVAGGDIGREVRRGLASAGDPDDGGSETGRTLPDEELATRWSRRLKHYDGLLGEGDGSNGGFGDIGNMQGKLNIADLQGDGGAKDGVRAQGLGQEFGKGQGPQAIIDRCCRLIVTVRVTRPDVSEKGCQVRCDGDRQFAIGLNSNINDSGL